MNWYRIKTALIGLKRLAELTDEDKQACIDAYKFLQSMQDGEPTETADETKAVADYYKVLNNMLSVFDLEKLYIPPQLDESQGLYGNQLLVEQAVLKELDLKDPQASHLLDMGCGRGRVSHYFSTLTGGQVSGYNIDANQIASAIDWATECRMSDRLHFKVRLRKIHARKDTHPAHRPDRWNHSLRRKRHHAAQPRRAHAVPPQASDHLSGSPLLT